jgi:hypothetical protein
MIGVKHNPYMYSRSYDMHACLHSELFMVLHQVDVRNAYDVSMSSVCDIIMAFIRSVMTKGNV